MAHVSSATIRSVKVSGAIVLDDVSEASAAAATDEEAVDCLFTRDALALAMSSSMLSATFRFSELMSLENVKFEIEISEGAGVCASTSEAGCCDGCESFGCESGGSIVVAVGAGAAGGSAA